MHYKLLLLVLLLLLLVLLLLLFLCKRWIQTIGNGRPSRRRRPRWRKGLRATMPQQPQGLHATMPQQPLESLRRSNVSFSASISVNLNQDFVPPFIITAKLFLCTLDHCARMRAIHLLYLLPCQPLVDAVDRVPRVSMFFNMNSGHVESMIQYKCDGTN